MKPSCVVPANFEELSHQLQLSNIEVSRDKIAHSHSVILEKFNEYGQDFPLSSREFRNETGNPYFKAMFLDHGVLNVEQTHIAGQRSRRYKYMNPPTGIKLYEFQTKPAIQRFSRQSELFKKRFEELPPDAKKQATLLRKQRVLLDDFDRNGLTPGDVISVTLFEAEQNGLKLPLYKVGRKGGRFYASHVFLPGDVRTHLLIDGEETSEIDVSHAGLLTLGEAARSELASEPDYKLFMSFVASGELYDYLAQKAGKSREAVKKEVQKIINGVYYLDPNGGIYVTRMGTVGEVLFEELPSVIRWLARLKGSEAEWSSAAYRKLIPIESGIMLPLAANLIDDGIPALTVHDSIICKSRDQNEVARRLEDAWLARTGLRPKLGIK